jgi:hypothetical protein
MNSSTGASAPSLIGGARADRLRAVIGVLRSPRFPWLWTSIVLILAAVLTVSRRPDSIFHAQFWAEDGLRWYANAYNWGWLQATLTSAGGYFQTLSRLTAALSLLVDLRYAPLVYNVVALVVQVLPAAFLATPRFSRAIPDFRIRLLLAFLYVGLPNSFELHVNITNAMTHLGLLAALVILAEPSKRAGWRVFDVSVLVLSGLSGPFAIALTPMAFLRWITNRADRWRLVAFLVVLTCAAIQALSVLAAGPSARPHGPLGATVHGFMAIVAGNVFAGAVIGLFHYTQLFAQAWWDPYSPALRATFLIGMAVFAYAAVRGTAELRLFILFAWIMLIGALLTPVLTLTGDQWPLLAHPGAGDRYYEIPMLAFVASGVWIMTRSGIAILRVAAGVLVATTIIVGIPGDWSYPPYVDLHPERYAAVLNRAAPGTRVVIPINPPGWTIELTRK